jgi:alkylated DNA repair dioxygenase AlkB
MLLKFPNIINQGGETIINQDGEAIYFGPLLNAEQNDDYFNILLNNIEWQPERVKLFGKEIITKRKVAFYADPLIEYTYSNKTKKGMPWTNTLFDIKRMIETHTKATYNACLLNLYHSGEEGMGWHSDDEKEIVKHSSIASLSIGVERNFAFKHKKTQEKVSIFLESGSLLEMKGAIQQYWLHTLPKSKKVNGPRINLTFRQMITVPQHELLQDKQSLYEK